MARMPGRTYVKPETLAVIRREVARVIADRRRAGQRKKPTAAQLAEWLGYSTKVVTQALQGIAGDVAFQQQAALPPART